MHIHTYAAIYVRRYQVVLLVSLQTTRSCIATNTIIVNIIIIFIFIGRLHHRRFISAAPHPSPVCMVLSSIGAAVSLLWLWHNFSRTIFVFQYFFIYLVFFYWILIFFFILLFFKFFVCFVPLLAFMPLAVLCVCVSAFIIVVFALLLISYIRIYESKNEANKLIHTFLFTYICMYVCLHTYSKRETHSYSRTREFVDCLRACLAF